MANRIELSSLIKSNRPDDILEWVNYHLAIGFDKITIFDNESKFSIKRLFEQNPKVDVWEVSGDYGYSASGIFNQCSLYTKFYNEKIGHSDWVSTIDDDEFIYIKSGKNIKDILNDELSVICILWKMISSSDMIETRSFTLINTFNYISFCTPWGNRLFVKSIVNLKRCKTISWRTPHIPTFNGERLAQTLEGIQIKDDFISPPIALNFYDSQNIVLYHYYHQSFEDRIWKATKAGLAAAVNAGRTVDKNGFISEITGIYIYQDNNMINRKRELSI
jgi:hypothetical protein